MKRTLSLEPAITAWMAYQAPRLRGRSFEKCQEHSKRWIEEWGDISLKRITTGAIDKFLGNRLQNCSPATVQLDRRILTGFFRWATRNGMVDGDPVKASRCPKMPEHTPRSLTREEEIKVLALMPPHWASMTVMAIESGLRVRTICELQWEWMNLETGWMRIPGHAVKSGRPLEVPLSLRALELLRGMAGTQNGRKLEGRIFATAHRDTIGDAFRNAVKAAGIPHCRFHDLRVTFFSRCRRRGVPIEVAMALSDHHSINVAMRIYRAVEAEEKLKALGREVAQESS